MDIKIEAHDDAFDETENNFKSTTNSTLLNDDISVSNMQENVMRMTREWGCQYLISENEAAEDASDNIEVDQLSNQDSLIDMDGKLIRVKIEPDDYNSDKIDEPQTIQPLKRTIFDPTDTACDTESIDGSTAKRKKTCQSQLKKKDHTYCIPKPVQVEDQTSSNLFRVLEIGDQISRWCNLATECKYNDTQLAETLIDSYYYMKQGDAAKVLFGKQYNKWMKLRKTLKLKTHEEMAKFLLQYYIDYTTNTTTHHKPPSRDSDSTQETPSNKLSNKVIDASIEETNTKELDTDEMVDVETLNFSGIMECNICKGQWLDEEKFGNHMRTCSDRHTIKKLEEVVITKADFTESQVEFNLLRCTHCQGNWSNEDKYNQHIEACRPTRKHLRILLPKIQITDIPINTELLTKSADVLYEKPNTVAENKVKKTRIQSQNLYQVGKTPMIHSNVNTCEDQITMPPIDLRHSATTIAKHITSASATSYPSVETKSDSKNVDDVTDDVFFECETCMQMFVTEQKFSNHSCKSIKTELALTFPCRFCIMGFRTYKLLENHMKKDHLEKIMTCEFCFTVFSQRTLFKNHIEMHCNKESGISFTCASCNLLFYTEVELKCHENEKHEMSHFPYVCGKCGKRFRNALNLDYHLIDNHDSFVKNNEEWDCSTCGKIFITRRKLKDHIRHVHPKVNMKCKVCGKAFKNKRSFEQHKSLHAIDLNKSIIGLEDL